MRIWAVIPAAGSGKRFGSELPKQFLELGSQTVLEHSLKRVLSHPDVHGAVIALHPDHFEQIFFVPSGKALVRVLGGKERMHSVFAALKAIEGKADWVLVHDAARPCLRQNDLQALVKTAHTCPDGSILAAPVRDTMKRGNSDQAIIETVDRHQLWHALTPQFFPYQTLMNAFNQAMNSGVVMTDESSIMEWAGFLPGLVPCSHSNIKITHPEDLRLAGFYLEQESCE